MKNTLEVLSIFFISILFLFHTTSNNSIGIKDRVVEVSSEVKQSPTKSVDYKATPIIIVKRD